MRRSKGTNENWVRDETMDSHKRKAIELVEKRNEYEKGKVITTRKHPNTFRCVIIECK